MKRIMLLIAAAFACMFAAVAQNPDEMKGQKTLVAYFSATGTTEGVAEMIAEATGGYLYGIEPETGYTSADLNWNDKGSRSSIEMNDSSSRPAIKKSLENASEYDVVYIGFPIWWNLAPRVINTFLETYDFSGKKVIPFATSGGSGITNSVNELKKAYPSINWQTGRLLNRATKAVIEEWVK